MTPEQAVQILFNAARRAQMSADEHVQAQEAARLLVDTMKKVGLDIKLPSEEKTDDA